MTRQNLDGASSSGLWIVGAGGFGRETLDACVAAQQPVAGFLDDDEALQEAAVHDHVVRSPGSVSDGEAVVAVASPTARMRLVERLQGTVRWGAVTHPSAVLTPRTDLGEGVIILALSFLSSDVQLGDHVQVNYGVSVGHDTTVAAATTFLPGARVAGGVRLGERCLLGANSTVLQGLRIGDGATVGAGAVVTEDVPDGATVVGIPARPVR